MPYRIAQIEAVTNGNDSNFIVEIGLVAACSEAELVDISNEKFNAWRLRRAQCPSLKVV